MPSSSHALGVRRQVFSGRWGSAALATVSSRRWPDAARKTWLLEGVRSGGFEASRRGQWASQGHPSARFLHSSSSCRLSCPRMHFWCRISKDRPHLLEDQVVLQSPILTPPRSCCTTKPRQSSSGCVQSRESVLENR